MSQQLAHNRTGAIVKEVIGNSPNSPMASGAPSMGGRECECQTSGGDDG